MNNLSLNGLYEYIKRLEKKIGKGGEKTTVTVNVGSTTTGQPGSAANVTNRGDEVNVLLDFTIPRGTQGAKGEPGETGPKGDKGDPGVIEAYPISGATPLSADWLSDTSGGEPLTPEAERIYILMVADGDYDENTMFRWGGSSYEILSSAGGSNYHIELTQAEYDALTPEQKTNGSVYFITDGMPTTIVVNDSVPIGAIQFFAGGNSPKGWLICDGSAVSRTQYSDLFDVIGTTYGSGDGSTTFNLPDQRGRVLIGAGSGYSLGATGGEKTHTLTVNEMPAHEHEVKWEHSYLVSLNKGSSGYGYALNFGTPEGDGRLYGASIGGGQAHNNMQPYLTVNSIIKVKNPVPVPTSLPVGSYYETSDEDFDPNIEWDGTWVLDSKGTVTVALDENQTEFNTVGKTGGSTTHTLSINEMPSHAHTSKTSLVNANGQGSDARAQGGTTLGFAFQMETTNSTGGSQPHNNLQPYTVVCRWHRIA